MAGTLLIQYSMEQPDHAIWSQVNKQGELISKITRGSLTDATELATVSHKVVVLLDSSCLHFNKVSLPTQNKAKMLRAVPYALEEQVADDVDDFHFVIDKTDQDGKVPVVGIELKTLDELLEVFNNAGIFIDAIVPDALCLTADHLQWAILYHDDKAYLQFDALHGGLYDRDILPVILESALKQRTENPPEKIIIFSDEGKTTEDLSAVVGDNIEVLSVSYNTDPLVVFCGQYKHALPLNLLQDKYKPKRNNTAQWDKWALAASLAAVWLVLHLGTVAFQHFDLKAKNKTLSAQITSTYKKSFPQSKRVVNARVQMEQKLNALKGNKGGGDSSMMQLLIDASTALTNDKSLTIESINYRNNRMDIGLISKNLQSIETLNTSLNKSSGLKSEITSSSSAKENVKGNIRLQRAGT